MRVPQSHLSCTLAILVSLCGCRSQGTPKSLVDGAAGGRGGGAVIPDAPASGGSSGAGGSLTGTSITVGGNAGSSAGSGTGGASGGNTVGSGGTARDAGLPQNDGPISTSDGVVELNAAELCRTAVRLQAERAFLCLGGESLEKRLRLANACPDYYFNADSNRKVEQVAACLDALAERSCTDVALGLLPACLANGKRPVGAGCAYSSQCQSGRCDSTGEYCSTCRAGGAPVGSPCADGGCQNGSFCDLATRICTDASTIVHAAEGQPCDLSATPVVGCVGDLLCVPESAGLSPTAGICTPAPAVGQPCASNGGSRVVCAAGATCIGDSAGGGICGLAGACGDAGLHCDADSYCQGSNAAFSCVPHAIAGQPCDDPSSGAASYCLSPAYCFYSTRTCTMPAARGEPCDTDHLCASLLSCVAGTCQPLGSVSCPASGDAGAPG